MKILTASTILIVACAATPPPAPVAQVAAPASHTPPSVASGGAPSDAAIQSTRFRDACEVSHDAMACVAGANASSDAVLAHTLLFHGCFLGSRGACRALLVEQISRENKPVSRARAEVEQALTEGCAYGKQDACNAAGSFISGEDEKIQQREENQKREKEEKSREAALEIGAMPPRSNLAAPDAESMEMQDEIGRMQACSRSCTDDYMKRGTSCKGTTTTQVQRCVSSAMKTMVTCMNMCGDKSQTACETKFPHYCDSMRQITQSLSNFQIPKSAFPGGQ